MTEPLETIYYEKDPINYIYFVKCGVCNYVLPRYMNSPFIEIVKCSHFGLMDIIACIFEKNNDNLERIGLMCLIEGH